MIKLACNSLISLERGSGEWMDAEEFVDMAYELRLDAVDFQIRPRGAVARPGVPDAPEAGVPGARPPHRLPRYRQRLRRG